MDPQPKTSLELHDVDDVRRHLSELVWPQGKGADRVGVEMEVFPIRVVDHRPAGRLPLEGPGGVRDLVREALTSAGDVPAVSGAIPTPGGGRVTFEPGGQIEHSSAPHADLTSVFDEIDPIWDTLEEVFAGADVSLVPLGIDPWHPVSEVPQQLEAGRYRSMERYFDEAWPDGAVMMRNSCSIQVNVDAGTGSTRAERWLAANLMAPVLTSMFSTSPTASMTGRRAQVWQSIDPSRTGLPRWDPGDTPDPLEDCFERVLTANVMYVERDGEARRLSPGFTFSDWLDQPHPRLGRPNADDLAVHLSTIFTEVRPRKGTLEIRSIDALPRDWWVVPPALVSALLYDDEAKGQVIETLLPGLHETHHQLAEAADVGMGSNRLATVAGKIGRLSLDAACRDPRFPKWAVSRLEAFLERYTFRGLSPADEIRPLLDQPAELLAWATRPTT